jgi:hypothetical protein
MPSAGRIARAKAGNQSFAVNKNVNPRSTKVRARECRGKYSAARGNYDALQDQKPDYFTNGQEQESFCLWRKFSWQRPDARKSFDTRLQRSSEKNGRVLGLGYRACGALARDKQNASAQRRICRL